MKFSKTSLFAIGGITLAASLLAPRAAHAVVATLVQVANTRSTPVPNQDVDHPARHPFTATCTSPVQTTFVSCTPTPAPPASGFETVIQNVSILVNRFGGTGAPVYTEIDYVNGGTPYTLYLPFVTQADTPGHGFWVVNQPVTAYLDPGAVGPRCLALMIDTSTSAEVFCTVTGYTVSLP